MSDNVNPLHWPGIFMGLSHYPRISWEEALQGARFMESQHASVQAGLGNLSLIKNPLCRPPDFQERSIPTPPAPRVSIPWPPRDPAHAVPKNPAPAWPLQAYPPPVHARTAYPSPAYPPPAYPASVRPYIRPAIEDDAEEIVQILNYHTSVSPFDPEYEMMEPEHVCNFIEACKLRKLPFLVLVKPADPSQTSQEPPKSKICGLTYIDTFDEEPGEDTLGDLRVYIRPGMTRHGYGTLLVDCILSICDEHYRRKFNYEWRPVGDVQLQVLRLKQLLCPIVYPAQLAAKYLFIQHWLKNTFGFLDFGEVRQDRAKYGYEENYYCVRLFINAGRRERRVQVPRRYQ